MGTETTATQQVAGGVEGKPAPMVQEVPPNDGAMYYGNNGYATHYFYDYHPGAYAESPGVPPETWEEYMRYMGMESTDSSQQQAMYNAEMGSMYMQTPQGYGYPSPGPYSTYTPGAPSMGADGQLYGPQPPYPYPNPIFHQHPISNGGQYIQTGNGTTPNGNEATVGHPGAGGEQNTGNGTGPISTTEPPPPGTLNVRPGGGVPVGGVALVPAPVTYGRVVNMPQGTQDVRYDNNRTGPWNDPGKGVEGQHRLGSGMPMPMQSFPRLPGVQTPGVGPLNGGRGYHPMARNGQNGFGRGGRGGVGTYIDNRNGGGRGFSGGFDKGRGRGGRTGGMQVTNGTGLFDVASEQNRGPRTIRMRGQRGPTATTLGTVVEGAPEYNLPDFRTKYESAKFFVIKSYSEDDVHKCIKYGVWASTPTGNKRLEAAYQDAQVLGEKVKGGCPVFFFFSVNASGQFCGVAEMVGPVDHTKSVEYWQQDKWSGQFKVKWHIIKDVPNGQFRHIILANNENKPVTNSRDTQEVKFEQGSEILEIFKNYTAKTSILDDFTFYDDRQKAMQEKRARLQQQQRLRLRQTKPPGAQTPGGTEDVSEAGTTENGNAERVNGSSEELSSSAGEVESSAVKKDDKVSAGELVNGSSEGSKPGSVASGEKDSTKGRTAGESEPTSSVISSLSKSIQELNVK